MASVDPAHCAVSGTEHERDRPGRRNTRPSLEVLRAKMNLLAAEGWSMTPITATCARARSRVAVAEAFL